MEATVPSPDWVAAVAPQGMTAIPRPSPIACLAGWLTLPGTQVQSEVNPVHGNGFRSDGVQGDFLGGRGSGGSEQAVPQPVGQVGLLSGEAGGGLGVKCLSWECLELSCSREACPSQSRSLDDLPTHADLKLLLNALFFIPQSYLPWTLGAVSSAEWSPISKCSWPPWRRLGEEGLHGGWLAGGPPPGGCCGSHLFHM